MKNPRTEKIAQRVTPLVAKLLELEQKENGGTPGDALERMIIRASNSEAAKKLIIEEARQHPLLSPLVEKLTEDGQFQKSKKTGGR